MVNIHASSTLDFASMNCETLSVIICFGLPRLLINLLRHKRNCSADMSLMSSKWTALNTKQVNRQTHTSFTFTFKGPRQSRPVYVKREDSSIFEGGYGAIWGHSVWTPLMSSAFTSTVQKTLSDCWSFLCIQNSLLIVA